MRIESSVEAEELGGPAHAKASRRVRPRPQLLEGVQQGDEHAPVLARSTLALQIEKKPSELRVLPD